MPKEIPLDVRMRIIELLILGNSVPETAKATSVSESTVRNVQNDFNAGKITGYEAFIDCLPDLKWVSAKLKENGLSVEKAGVGWATYETIAKLGLPGLDPKDFSAALVRLLRLLPPDFPADKLVNAAVALLRIEVETGRSYEEIVKGAQDLATRVKSLEGTMVSLTQQKESLEKTIADLQKLSRDAYVKNQLTEKQASDLSAILKRLASAGISLEDLEKLRQVLMVARSEGWRPRDIIRSLATIGNLQTNIQNLQNQLANLHTTIGEENRTLGILRSQVAAVQSQLATLLVSAKTAHDQLSQLQKLTAQAQLQRQTVDTFFKLLSDPSTVTDAQLQRFTEQAIELHLSGKLTVGLPIDYGKLREEMKFLLEAALGKQVVSRETHDAEIKALRDQNSDLLLGGIITFKREHARLRKLKTELAEVSAEKIITTLAEQNLDLEITVFKCLECHALGSCYRPPETKPLKPRCSACTSDNLKILSKTHTYTHNKTDQNTRTSEPQIEQITPQINHK